MWVFLFPLTHMIVIKGFIRCFIINLIISSQIEICETSYDRKIRSPGSPERQYCSSTTQPHTDSGIGLIQVINKTLYTFVQISKHLPHFFNKCSYEKSRLKAFITAYEIALTFWIY